VEVAEQHQNQNPFSHITTLFFLSGFYYLLLLLPIPLFHRQDLIFIFLNFFITLCLILPWPAIYGIYIF